MQKVVVGSIIRLLPLSFVSIKFDSGELLHQSEQAVLQTSHLI